MPNLEAPGKNSSPPGEEGETPSPQMRIELSSQQIEARGGFRAFVDEHVRPFAGEWDRLESMPAEMVSRLRERNWLGAIAPREAGGGGMDPITYGLLTEAIGSGCSSLRSLLTVHDMVTLTVLRWGKKDLKESWGPRLACGESIGALALSEPNAGSDAAGVETVARPDGDSFILQGAKKWVTFGQIADAYLVLAQCEGKPTGFLVPAETEGLQRKPMCGLMSTRASMVAELHLDDCRLAASCMLGRIGFGVSHIASTALDHGRYSVAWGSVGIAQACLDACQEYASQRRTFGKRLDEHQLLQRKLTEMTAETRAARLLCYRAGYQRRTGHFAAASETMLAKYFASRVAVRAASDAVQMHGANGIGDEYPVARYLRDSKLTEIIEGSSQIIQTLIPSLPMPEI